MPQGRTHPRGWGETCPWAPHLRVRTSSGPGRPVQRPAFLCFDSTDCNSISSSEGSEWRSVPSLPTPPKEIQAEDCPPGVSLGSAGDTDGKSQTKKQKQKQNPGRAGGLAAGAVSAQRPSPGGAPTWLRKDLSGDTPGPAQPRPAAAPPRGQDPPPTEPAWRDTG